MSRPSQRVIVRRTEPEDFAQITAMSRACYPQDREPWNARYLSSHLDVFAEGQLVAVDSRTSEVVGMAASLIVLWDEYDLSTSWHDFTDEGMFTNHDPTGRTLYGAEVMVAPQAQGRGVGKRLYAARRDLCRRLGLLRIRAGARLRGYHRYADEMTPEQYVVEVINRRLGDPTLSFQLKQGFRVLGVVRNYLDRGVDPASRGHAAVIEWINHLVARRSDYRHRDPRYGRRRMRVDPSGPSA